MPVTKWIDVEQNSDEWFDLRLGRATSSNFDTIMANDGKAFGDPAKKYAQKVALERLTGKRDLTGNFQSKSMERGNILEPVVRAMYEKETFYSVTNGGIHISDKLGDSADGLVGKRGCVEIKVVEPTAFWDRLKHGGIKKAYKYQIQGHLYLGERDWCDFVCMCPEFPKGKSLYIYRQRRDEDMQAKLKTRLMLFENLICENLRMLQDG